MMSVVEEVIGGLAVLKMDSDTDNCVQEIYWEALLGTTSVREAGQQDRVETEVKTRCICNR